MNIALPHPHTVTPGSSDWVQDRLTEARGVLADTTQHPDTLIILAARVVIGQTDDARECSDAIDLLRLLDRRPLQVVAAAAFPKGGAA
jgi:hypothetical protein